METFKDVISGEQLVLVDFFATWCQPCKMMHNILEQAKEVLSDRIRIIKVDLDKYGVTVSQYGILSVLTLMLFKHGEVLWRMSGMVEKSELLATIDPFSNSVNGSFCICANQSFPRGNHYSVISKTGGLISR